MMGEKGAEAMRPSEESRAAYAREALALPRPAWPGFTGEFGASAEDELLWMSVLALDEENTRRALAAGADVRRRRDVDGEGLEEPKNISLFQAWVIAVRRNPEKAMMGRAAPVALALEEHGALDIRGQEAGGEGDGGLISRKERRLRDIGHWRDAWPRSSRGAMSAKEGEKDEAMSSSLLGVIELWVKDPGPDSISLVEVAQVAVSASGSNEKIRSWARGLALMGALESRFGALFSAKDWASIAMRPGWSPLDDSRRQVVDGAVMALAGSSVELDPWEAGWLASLGIMAHSFALVEGVVKRSPAMHWRVPQEALAWFGGGSILWPNGAAEPGNVAVSLAHLALLHYDADKKFDIARALLKNPVFAQGACENPLPSFLAYCAFERYERLVDEFPGLGQSGVDGENVAHAWARLMLASGSGAAEGMLERCFKPLLESRLASLAVQKNARGETPGELFEAALVACGASAEPWREAFAKWERREVAEAALAAPNSEHGGHRL